MAKGVFNKGMIGAMVVNHQQEDERFNEESIAKSRAERKKIDQTKYKIRLQTKLQIGTVPAGYVATGERWRSIAGVSEITGCRPANSSIAPAVFDLLEETNDELSPE